MGSGLCHLRTKGGRISFICISTLSSDLRGLACLTVDMQESWDDILTWEIRSRV